MRAGALVLLAFGFAGTASAGQLEDAKAALEHRHCSVALGLWRPLAEQGNATAETGMGILYENGCGVPKDETQAVAWYQKAAGQGDAEAEYRLGERYVLGYAQPA
ncbi:sel1 repeat family protein [Trinickia dinghuensis]|uniref:Sel1 repeat family protein n=2 Tax=Trinickia dinghuensis TaxID=2291023 RepID=A0A3D8K6E0_9BURK|nr:sel1 repeat family protein [Trinickia dinghuensis]